MYFTHEKISSAICLWGVILCACAYMMCFKYASHTHMSATNILFKCLFIFASARETKRLGIELYKMCLPHRAAHPSNPSSQWCGFTVTGSYERRGIHHQHNVQILQHIYIHMYCKKNCMHKILDTLCTHMENVKRDKNENEEWMIRNVTGWIIRNVLYLCIREENE